MQYLSSILFRQNILYLLFLGLFLSRTTLQAQHQLPDSFPRGLLKKLLPTYVTDEKVMEHMEHLKDLSVIFYFRPEFHWNLDKQSITNEHRAGTGDFFLRPIRLDITGPIIPKKLSFRFRTRAYQTFTHDDIKEYNRINFSLDYTYLNWDINEHWGLMAGKNLRLYGGYEWDMMNIYVHHYNHYFLSVENPFPLGLYVRYKFNAHHSLLLGAYQANNKTIDNLEKSTGFRVKYQPKQVASGFPVGGGIYWDGDFLKGKIHTKWSVYAEHPLTCESNITAVLGQKLTTKKVEFWMDLTLAYMATDITTLTTPLIDRVKQPQEYQANYTSGTDGSFQGLKPGATPLFFAKDVFYNVLSLRLDYHMGKHFIWVFTGQYEHADKLKDLTHTVGNGFRKILYTNLTLEYYPFPTQRLSFFIFTDQENTWYNQQLQQTGIPEHFITHKIGIGILYPMPIF